MNTNKKYNKGFSLFELLVVISIIAIISAIGLTSYTQTQKRARDAKRREDIQAVSKALEQYYGVNSVYIVGCNPGADYLPGGMPTDPKNSGSFVYEWTDDCSTTAYCVCARLEDTTGGNSMNETCTFAASSEYYCVKNQQ
jgi:prepilin-type N-terminal cleavage/methylation domain-containing protein